MIILRHSQAVIVIGVTKRAFWCATGFLRLESDSREGGVERDFPRKGRQRRQG